MKIVCFVSGSGTNYAHIVERDPEHDYFVFTNRPGCLGTEIARRNGHPVIELNHEPFLRAAGNDHGVGTVARNSLERARYEQEVNRLLEERIGGKPDLICLAGYDLLSTDWMVEAYYPRMLNVHPGDTTRGYVGLHWIPSAKAIVAGEESIRSTLFLVDKGMDTGPVLAQSRPLNMARTLHETENSRLSDGLSVVRRFVRDHSVTSYDAFRKIAGVPEKEMMRLVCENLQEALKVRGDWEIYPFGVHDLIGQGRVEVDGRAVYVDGKLLPEHGFRMEGVTGL